jgi:hypothetical protein
LCTHHVDVRVCSAFEICGQPYDNKCLVSDRLFDGGANHNTSTLNIPTVPSSHESTYENSKCHSAADKTSIPSTVLSTDMETSSKAHQLTICVTNLIHSNQCPVVFPDLTSSIELSDIPTNSCSYSTTVTFSFVTSINAQHNRCSVEVYTFFTSIELNYTPTNSGACPTTITFSFGTPISVQSNSCSVEVYTFVTSIELNYTPTNSGAYPTTITFSFGTPNNAQSNRYSINSCSYSTTVTFSFVASINVQPNN